MPLAHGIVAVPHVQLGDLVEQVLGGVGGVDVAGAGIGAHAKQGDPAGGLELGVERELILHLGDAVVVGARAGHVDVMAARVEAGAHHVEIGGGQGRVQENGGAGVTNGVGHGGAIAGVEPAVGDAWITQTVRKEGSAGGHRVRDDELLEHRVLHEFEGGHGPHRAGA